MTDRTDSVITRLAHADAGAHELDIAPPIYQGVPFAASSGNHFAEMSAAARHDRFYRRYGNPTQTRAETLLADLEGTEAALLTSSGMAATTTAFLTLVRQGDHVVAQRSMYAGTLALLQEIAPRFGIRVTLVDQTDLAQWEDAIGHDTRLVMMETPSNPMLQLTDVAAVADMARAVGALSMIDNTVATPANQQPAALGVDLIIHSVTKMLSGHSDVLGGALLGWKELIDEVWHKHIVFGGVSAPFDAWLTLRGLRTFSLRMDAVNAATLQVAEFLEKHDRVEKVNYPGLASHPQYELAARQMRGFGALLSFDVAAGYDAADRLLSRVRLPARSASLGGYRSLIVQPAALWAQDLSPEQIEAAGVSPGLVRLAVGLESAEDLIADLDEALKPPSSN